MGWGKDDNQGPWGRPSGGNGGGRSGKTPPPPNSPDLDELFKKSHDKFRRMMGGGGNDGEGKRGLAFFGAVIALFWAGSGIYLVKADEQGVEMRFGKFNAVTPPGIHYHLPYPIETVLTPKVTTVNRIEIGFRTGFGSRSGRNETSVPEESLMLSGDENIVDVNFEVQWKINKAEDYLFNVRAPEETLRAVAESAMREVMGRTAIAQVLAEGKLGAEQAAMEISVKKLVQTALNSYKTGVEIVSINLMKVEPPSQVTDAFRDVQNAKTDMETARNQAEAYRNDIIPRARGEAQKMILDAEAYKQEVVARAKGEASRFSAVHAEYREAKDVTKKRMYLETMEEILPGMSKLVMEKGGALPYLPLNELKPATGKQQEVKP
jgi:membrane protease subunit HflK